MNSMKPKEDRDGVGSREITSSLAMSSGKAAMEAARERPGEIQTFEKRIEEWICEAL